MKKVLIICLILLTSSVLFGQRSNLVFFSEQGERFLLVLNGIQQNGDPETNVKITNLPATTYKVKIIFEDTKIPSLDKSVYMEPGYEYTCNVRKNQKGEYVIRLLSQVVLEQAPPSAPAQRIYLYTTTPAVSTVTTTVTTGTSVTTGSPAGASISAGGVSAEVAGGTMTTQVTSMTTTQTVSTSVSGEPQADEVYVMPGYNGPYGCRYPMQDRDFQMAKSSISTKTFEDDKLTIARQVTGSNCLLCSQIKEIMKLFTYEDTRLEFAKYAFRYAFDQGNYYQLNDAFQYSSSISELDDYIRGGR